MLVKWRGHIFKLYFLFSVFHFVHVDRHQNALDISHICNLAVWSFVCSVCRMGQRVFSLSWKTKLKTNHHLARLHLLNFLPFASKQTQPKDRQIDKQTDRHKDRHSATQTDTQTHRQNRRGVLSKRERQGWGQELKIRGGNCCKTRQPLRRMRGGGRDRLMRFCSRRHSSYSILAPVLQSL